MQVLTNLVFQDHKNKTDECHSKNFLHGINWVRHQVDSTY